ncbi:olfactory receptor 1500-like [Oreochromis aureus]|uniref:G-protein coupled receptors family 1 profile domain-containing protein n=1 Tax=Oreochromis aureus TaxID=47969 RepID=A0AAZ1XRG2_OREAU|nr:olfactory receptor 1500-like [Oreochromis aureus]
MALINSAAENNITFVRPAYFIISGFIGIPNIRYYFVFLCFIYILAVVGNTLVIIVITLDHMLRSPKYIAVFNLAFTDLLSSCALVPKVLDIFLFNHYHISYNDCLTFMFFCFTSIFMQAFNLVVLSFDRVMAIMYPLHYQMRVTHKLILSLIAFFWLLAITLILIAVGLLTRLSFCQSVIIQSYYCDHGPMYRLGCNDVTPNYIFAVLTIVLVLGVPLAFIVGSYCCIGYSLSKISTFRERVKAFKTCTGHLSLVAIYFLPVIFVYAFGRVIHPNARIINLSIATVLPPMLNPIIYVLQTQEIKESLRRLLKARVQAKLEVFRFKPL